MEEKCRECSNSSGMSGRRPSTSKRVRNLNAIAAAAAVAAAAADTPTRRLDDDNNDAVYNDSDSRAKPEPTTLLDEHHSRNWSQARNRHRDTAPSTSRSSMSLLSANFLRSTHRHDFGHDGAIQSMPIRAVVVDDDDTTRTSGVLETFGMVASAACTIATAEVEAVADPAAEVGEIDDDSDDDDDVDDCDRGNGEDGDDGSSSTNGIVKLVEVEVEVSNAATCHTTTDYYNDSEIYVIQDDDDDEAAHDRRLIADEEDTQQCANDRNVGDEDDDAENDGEEDDDESTANTSQLRAAHSSNLESQLSGVIVTTGASTIYLETPVVEEPQSHHHHHLHHPLHPQIINLSGAPDDEDIAATKHSQPKRLSDEFLVGEDLDGELDTDKIVADGDVCEVGANASVETTASTPNGAVSGACTNNDSNDAAAMATGVVLAAAAATLMDNVDMSFRLKKMNINNSSTTVTTTTVAAVQESLASGETAADIDAMDLIERRDFETEQRITGGILLKSSALMSRNMLNLSLIKPCGSGQTEQKAKSKQAATAHDNASYGASNCNNGTSSGRVVSSDSKCAYNKDPATTPTSSRTHNSRLTKSTAKLNLCSTLSHHHGQQQQQQRHNFQRTFAGAGQVATAAATVTDIASTTSNAPSSTTPPSLAASATSSSSSSSSVIVEAPSTSISTSTVPSTSVNATKSSEGGSTAAELFATSNNSSSNDSLMAAAAVSGSSSLATNSCQQQQTQKQQQQQHHHATDRGARAVVANEGGCSRTSALLTFDDAQPSTSTSSSARCQYALPSKGLRQVNASAQTSERFLARNLATTPAAAATASATAANLATTAGSSASGSEAAPSASANGSNLNGAGSRHRRRTQPTAQLSSNSTSEEVIAAFKVMVAEAKAAEAAERKDFNEDSSWADCEENNSDMEEVCTCRHTSSDTGSSHGGSQTSLDTDDLDAIASVYAKESDLSNYIQMVSISEDGGAAVASSSSNSNSVSFSASASTSACVTNSSNAASTLNNHAQHQQQRKRKYESRQLDAADCGGTGAGHGSSVGGVYAGVGIGRSSLCAADGEMNSRKRIAYDYASTPRSSQSGVLTLPSTPTTTTQLSLIGGGVIGSPLGRRTPRSLIPTRDNPPPELQHWLTQFQRWSHAERLLAVDLLIEHCEPTQVRHMMKVIEPQFQRDFISLLPRELALQVLSYLDPKDLVRAAQTCRSWRFLCDDNLLWKEKCRKAQILTEPRTDRPRRGRAGNMPPSASPWKAAYMRQHIIEMNWRSRPIREPKVLKGHDDHVITCLQFAGNRIVSGSDDNTLKVWSAVTGRCLRTLVGHTGGVWSSQMSGNIIISGSTDRTLKVWDMETGQCVHTLLGHTSTVRCMHLHGSKVVSGSRDATLRVWDIEQGTCLHVLVGHLAAVRCVQYDGKLIVSGAYDYMVKIWHPERQECLHTLQGHTNRVYSLQFDGLHVVSGSLDTSIRVWDVETGNCKHTLMGHQSLTSGMELRQNILVSGNADSTVKVWDITTGQCLQTLSGHNKHQSAVTCLQFNSRFVVTSSDDGTVKLWDVKTGEFIRNLVALESGGSGGVVWRIRANDTKLICAVGSRNGTEETKLMVLDFDVEGACVKCS